jgi:hypothetical protein
MTLNNNQINNYKEREKPMEKELLFNRILTPNALKKISLLYSVIRKERIKHETESDENSCKVVIKNLESKVWEVFQNVLDDKNGFLKLDVSESDLIIILLKNELMEIKQIKLSDVIDFDNFNNSESLNEINKIIENAGLIKKMIDD